MKKLFIFILTLLVLILVGITLYYLNLTKNNSSKVEAAKENALSKTMKVNARGDVLLVDKPEYQIIYFQKEDQFLISILKSPFEAIREEAEDEFLQITKADQETLCKLDVVLTTPSFANPSLAGKIVYLSFCQTSIQ